VADAASHGVCENREITITVSKSSAKRWHQLRADIAIYP
jgi:hypothetical protein